MVSDGAKTFLKLFSLRGGGHYLPHGFRFSPFLLKYSAHDDVYILALVDPQMALFKNNSYFH